MAEPEFVEVDAGSPAAQAVIATTTTRMPVSGSRSGSEQVAARRRASEGPGKLA